MSTVQTQAHREWEKEALNKFNTMIERIPLFHRKIAQQVVHKKAELNCQQGGRAVVEESEVLRLQLRN